MTLSSNDPYPILATLMTGLTAMELDVQERYPRPETTMFVVSELPMTL